MNIYTNQTDPSKRIHEPILTLIEKLHLPKHEVILKSSSVMHETAFV